MASVMGAYNRVYGESASASPRFLGQILRKDWGFKGLAVRAGYAVIGLIHLALAGSAASLVLGRSRGGRFALRSHHIASQRQVRCRLRPDLE